MCSLCLKNAELCGAACVDAMPVSAPKGAKGMLMHGSKVAGNLSLVSHLYARKVSPTSSPILRSLCTQGRPWCGVPSSNEVLLRSQLAVSWGFPCPLPRLTEAASGLQAASAEG